MNLYSLAIEVDFQSTGTMMEWTINELLDRLQARDECHRIEAKEARNSLGNSALETISAFSNEPGLGGGYLILGLRKNSDSSRGHLYEVCGVVDPDSLQRELSNVCRNNFNRRIIPEISVHVVKTQPLVIAFIPEAFCRDKPIYIKIKGEKAGTFRRLGSSDVRCTDEDLDLLYQLRRQINYELEVLPGVTWEDISKEAINEYRRMRAKVDSNASELRLEDQELLISLNMAVKDNGKIVPTIGGLLFFGSKAALRREFPMASRVDYIVMNGTTWVEDPSARWELSLEYREALVILLPRLHVQIMSDIPKKFGLKPGELQRTDVPQIPVTVIREALLNALIHRDYRSHQPTQIIRYSNRLEFRNAGYSLKLIEDLEEPGSKPRNPAIAAVFYDLDEVETKGTGIQTMKVEMKKAGLSTPPIFESNREKNEFDLILFPHHLLDQDALEWLQQFKSEELTDAQRRALAFVREVGAITNQDYRQLNGVDTLVASRILTGLRDLGLLAQRGSGNGTYYVLADRDKCNANEILESKELTPHTNPLSEGLTPHTNPLSEGLTPHTNPLSEGLTSIPDNLRMEANLIKRRCKPSELKRMIKKICKIRPFRLAELAKILKRRPRYLRDYYLAKMIESGELKYLYPDQTAHPLQAYRTSEMG